MLSKMLSNHWRKKQGILKNNEYGYGNPFEKTYDDKKYSNGQNKYDEKKPKKSS